jgi:protease I
MTRPLSGRRIAVLAADGFEKIELTIPVAALKAAGAVVDIVSLRPGRIRGVNLHEPAGRVRVTRTLARATAADYDGLFIPGGYISPDLLRQSEAAREFVRAFDRARQPIATFCHGPWLLASAGVLSGRTLTSWPGIRDDMVGAGATWLDQPVVRDGHLITSRGPQDFVPFIRGIIEHFAGRRAPVEVRATTSSPQRNEPPAVLLTAMKWVPRPSLRTAALSLGLVAVGLVVAGGAGRPGQQ